MAKNNPIMKKDAAVSPSPAYKQHVNVGESISINTTGGKYLKKLTYMIDTADLVNEIIVNGQRVQSVAGKSFLILNLKISNANQQDIQISSRDYVRLSSPNNNSEWWAPEIYNDPLVIQAISTKLSRIGFTVDSSQRIFELKAGEIGGDKQDIEIKF